jgi:hypothetical protein
MLDRRLLSLAVLCLAFVLGANAAMAHEIEVPFAEVAQTANLVFVGTVESQSSRLNPQGNMVFTDVTFADVEIVNATSLSKQNGATSIRLTFAGGTVAGLSVSLCSSLRVRTGSRYVLFAFDDDNVYASPLVGGSQGLFEVVRDRRTGEEFVLTAGRHAVVAVEGKNLVSSEARVVAIEGGNLVLDPSQESNKSDVEAPVSSDGVRAVSPARGKDGASARPLSLRTFVERIRSVSLKAPLTERTLRFGDGGQFLKSVDGRTVAEPLKRPSARPLGGRASESKAPQIPRGGAEGASTGSSGLAGNDKVRGGAMGACGYHQTFINMEQYPSNWSEFNIANDCMWTWNQSRDVFRWIPDDGNYGHNTVNEFAGYPTNQDLMNIYGLGYGSGAALCIDYSFPDCGEIVESDVFINPAFSWSDDPNVTVGSATVQNLRQALMHEIGHAWGDQRQGYAETYDYDLPSVMHRLTRSVEDGWGVHAVDAQLIRAIYDWQGVGADMGVESYYASNGLKNSTISGTTFKPGDPITLGKVTVENMSNFTMQGVNVRFYLSADRIITTGDVQMGGAWSWDNGFVAEGVSVFDYSMAIPSGMSSGTYYVGAVVTINGFEGDAYPWNNATYFSDPIRVLAIASPVVDRVTAVSVAGRPFKLKMFGSDFQPGIRVFLGGDGLEWTSTRFKHNGLFVIKGGEALMRQFPAGVDVPIRLVNPDGGETFLTFAR